MTYRKLSRAIAVVALEARRPGSQPSAFDAPGLAPSDVLGA